MNKIVVSRNLRRKPASILTRDKNWRLIRPSPLWGIAAFFAACSFAVAATITVTNPADVHVDGQISLREAVASSASGDVIAFAVDQRVELTRGEIQINHNLSLQGPAGRTQLVTRKAYSVEMQVPLFRIFTITTGTVSISNLTFGGGLFQGADSPATVPEKDSHGGAIQNLATLILTDCQFSKNYAQGGVGYTGETKSVGGTAKGGALYNGGTVVIRNCFFGENVASGGLSGGLGTPGGVGAGGAIFNAGTARIFNCTFGLNLAQGTNGGPGEGTTPGGKAGEGQGGAIYNEGALFLESCTISGNYATAGPAYTAGDARGGGLVASRDGVGKATLRNTIIAKNTALPSLGSPSGIARGPDVVGAVTSGGYNLIGVGTDSAGWQTTDQVGNRVPIDPLLQQFAFDNGGPTATFALRPGSPALDRGSSSGLATDQRGLARIYDNSAVANAPGGDGTDVGAFELQPAEPAIMQNISARAETLAADGAVIGGVVITGNALKKVLFRASGTAEFHSPADFLDDPTLELHARDGRLIATNDNWQDAQRTEIDLTGLRPLRDNDSAIVIALEPGAYTAIMRGKNGSTGIGLLEAYDVQPYGSSRLSNLSVRGYVGTGDRIIIDGFMLTGGGGGSSRILVRVLGPSLAEYNLNALRDPTLELHDEYGSIIAFNDDWKETQQAEIQNTGIPPSDKLESAIIADLVPGSYTAVARGFNDTTGIALVEVYKLK